MGDKGLRRAAWFGIVVGTLMFVQWGVFLATGQVPELATEPIRIGFHLAAEAVTALGLIAGGVGILRKRTWSKRVYTLAIGMLLYTSIVSPGYFAQQGTWLFVGMFAAIVVVALLMMGSIPD